MTKPGTLTRPLPDGVTAALLDPVNYPTRPAESLGNAGKLGSAVEARRMADFVVMPSEVNATITESSRFEIGAEALPVATAKSMALVVSGGPATSPPYTTTPPDS